MKRYNNLYDSITFKDFIDVYKDIRSNTKNKLKIKKFDDFYSINISRAYNLFKNKKYKPYKYNIFLIKKPKYRIIMSQNITDKLINHVVSRKILLPILDKLLINTNVATRKNKGTSYGLNYLKKYLLELKGKKVYALKFDISKYFYNIDHEILFNLLKNKIKDKDALNILKTIIDSTNYDYVNQNIKKIKNKEFIRVNNLNITLKEKDKTFNEINNIPYYKKGKGLPIGNMTSQILAIFYLNELDHYIKEKLHIKYYIRYMDDGVLFHTDKNYLKYCLNKINEIVNKYNLELNNKTKVINVNKEGIEFLGYKFNLKNKLIIKVRSSTLKRYNHKLKLIKNGFIKEEKAILIINSYNALFKYSSYY